MMGSMHYYAGFADFLLHESGTQNFSRFCKVSRPIGIGCGKKQVVKDKDIVARGIGLKAQNFGLPRGALTSEEEKGDNNSSIFTRCFQNELSNQTNKHVMWMALWYSYTSQMFGSC